MSATGTPTPNLGLRIPLGTDPAAVEDINYNAGVLDTKIGAIGNDTVKGLLDHASDEIGALGDGLAIIANGNTHAAIAAGEFVFVRNHSTLATGLYKATSSIAANATLSTSNLTADSKGGLNSLSDQIANINKSSSVSGTTNENGYLVTDIPYTKNIISARCNNPACGCLPLVYSGVWYFMPILVTSGVVSGLPNTSVTINYRYNE